MDAEQDNRTETSAFAKNQDRLILTSTGSQLVNDSSVDNE